MHFVLLVLIKSYAVQVKVLRVTCEFLQLRPTRSYAVSVLSYAVSYAGICAIPKTNVLRGNCLDRIVFYKI